ncbi:SH3 domain-containing protein [Thioflexithrix psekupsensis]|uniref:SH3b domain-containing protein n=1 Tax=Thioflexithrix psekupsensis TaxID=1570016 RepID=A0A251XAY3_9GAMM|nr:SH3 domain-containing protein [Thioflexithrix psekupsensis]OUD15458.1 hypothetical protein TPSD3_02730 [Thioflexithrix psekupsensis]
MSAVIRFFSVLLLSGWVVSSGAAPIPALPPEPPTLNELGYQTDTHHRLTIVSGARVRSQANNQSGVVATLTLGTTMKQIGRTAQPSALGDSKHYWYQVELDNQRRGWIFGSLTLPYHPSQHLEIYRKLVEERMGQSLSFADQMELTRLLQKLIAEIHEGDTPPKSLLAELQLAYLKSIQKTLDVYNQLSPTQRRQNPYSAWLRHLEQTAKEVIFFDEISARQLVKNEAFWELYEANPRMNQLSDHIAWTAANHPIGGECEGDLNCYFSYQLNSGLLRYLKHFPNSSYQQQALDTLLMETNPKDAYWSASDASELTQQLAQMTAILSQIDTPASTRLLAQLRRLSKS